MCRTMNLTVICNKLNGCIPNCEMLSDTETERRVPDKVCSPSFRVPKIHVGCVEPFQNTGLHQSECCRKNACKAAYRLFHIGRREVKLKKGGNACDTSCGTELNKIRAVEKLSHYTSLC